MLDRNLAIVRAALFGAMVGGVACGVLCTLYLNSGLHFVEQTCTSLPMVAFFLCPPVGAAAGCGVGAAWVLLMDDRRRAAGIACMAPTIALYLAFGRALFSGWQGYPSLGAYLAIVMVPLLVSAAAIGAGLYLIASAGRRSVYRTNRR